LLVALKISHFQHWHAFSFVVPDGRPIAFPQSSLLEGFLAIGEKYCAVSRPAGQHVERLGVHRRQGAQWRESDNLLNRPTFGGVGGDAKALVKMNEISIHRAPVVQGDLFIVDCLDQANIVVVEVSLVLDETSVIRTWSPTLRVISAVS
jgi:hypothetical protein